MEIQKVVNEKMHLVHMVQVPIVAQTRPAIPETFRKLRRVCGGDPKSAPECRAELDELERDLAAREAKDAFLKMRMKCILDRDPCDSSEA